VYLLAVAVEGDDVAGAVGNDNGDLPVVQKIGRDRLRVDLVKHDRKVGEHRAFGGASKKVVENGQSARPGAVPVKNLADRSNRRPTQRRGNRQKCPQ